MTYEASDEGHGGLAACPACVAPAVAAQAAETPDALLSSAVAPMTAQPTPV